MIYVKTVQTMLLYISGRSTYQNIHPLPDAAFDADRRASLKVLKIVTISLQNGL